jgi:hypothetical protein
VTNGLAKMMRELRGTMKLGDMADLCEMPQSFVHDVEHGKRGISGEMADRIDKALDLSILDASKLHKEAARYAGFKV